MNLTSYERTTALTYGLFRFQDLIMMFLSCLLCKISGTHD